MFVLLLFNAKTYIFWTRRALNERSKLLYLNYGMVMVLGNGNVTVSVWGNDLRHENKTTAPYQTNI